MIIDLELEIEEMKEHPQNYEPKKNIKTCCITNKLKNIKFQCATVNSNKVLKKIDYKYDTRYKFKSTKNI